MKPDYSVGFDYYGCTLTADPDELVSRLAKATSATPEFKSRVGRWTGLWMLHRGDDVICTVGYTDDRPDEPYFESKSHSPELVPLIRDWYPQHRVARVEARIDFHDELWWDVIEPLMREFHELRNVVLEPRGCHTQPHLGGRTWYAGKSDGARRYVKMYEKGCELGLRSRAPIRLEVTAKPASKLKAHYATLTAEEVLLDNRFVRWLLPKIGVDLGKAVIASPDKNRSDLDRLMDVFARQYLQTFKLLRERFTTMDEFCGELQARKALDDEVKAQRLKATVTSGWTAP